ncbi:MAG: hypothetical protein GY861_25465 [bacterium]|nr:hypothetical protein [bacterium]
MLDICPNSCNGRGDCVKGTCNCFHGWTGDDCSKPKCENKCSGNGKCEVK